VLNVELPTTSTKVKSSGKWKRRRVWGSCGGEGRDWNMNLGRKLFVVIHSLMIIITSLHKIYLSAVIWLILWYFANNRNIIVLLLLSKLLLLWLSFFKYIIFLRILLLYCRNFMKIIYIFKIRFYIFLFLNFAIYNWYNVINK